ncbi:SpoIIE family protein phosphatase [Streptomyces sp. NPDC091272]|uniref:SpoIIE family protein phosphatase n=1 Tax=Streptomyces sp. NPDC091272 TaxID=3365981 RepID=UPI0037FC6E31
MTITDGTTVLREGVTAEYTLLLCTDGLTEARQGDGSRLGEDGPARRLSTAGRRGAGGLVAAVDQLLSDLGPGVSDDTALLALSVPPPGRTADPAPAAVPTAEPAQENW